MILSSFKNLSSRPTKLAVATLLALYGFIMFKCLRLLITKLSSITMQHQGLHLLRTKFLEMVGLTKKYFIIFISYFYKAKGVEITC